MGILFSRKSETSAAAAPAKRNRNKLTCGELNDAIAKVSDVIDHSSTAWQSIEALYGLTLGAANGDIVTLKGAPPISVAELNDALAQMPEFEQSEGVLTALRRVRSLLEKERSARTSEPPQFVTVSQLKAFETSMFDAFAWALGAMATELNRSQPSKAHVLNMLKQSATTNERKKVLAGISGVRETEQRPMTNEEWLRYQNTGSRYPQ